MVTDVPGPPDFATNEPTASTRQPAPRRHLGETLIPTRTAHNGYSLPAIGFGTYRLNGRTGADTVRSAIQHGYRLLDSAFSYEHEGAVGHAVRQCGVDREELIITSKLPGRHHGFDQAIATVQESVYRTGLDCIDLYLIHWPNPQEDKYVDAWRGLIAARNSGLVRQIGVCNFLPEHLDRLHAETGELPVVNQIELHPYFPQIDALAFHRRHGILTQAWSPMGRGNDLLSNPVITEIAAARGISAAQTVLAWHAAINAIPLPKASSPDRQQENIDVLGIRLLAGEIVRITELGRPDGRNDNQDPAIYQEF